MIRRPPRSTQSRSSAASDVYKRQVEGEQRRDLPGGAAGGEEERDDRRRQADQRERERQGVRAPERGGEHDDHRRHGEHDEGQQRDEVAGGHGLPSVVVSSATVAPGGAPSARILTWGACAA